MTENVRFEVRGVVTGHGDSPLSGARVTVWWQRIRKRKKIATGETLNDGRYHLRFRVPNSHTEPVLVVVEASSEHLDAPLWSPLTQAKPRLEIDLHYERKDQSEWAKLVQGIDPLLEGLKLADLVEDSTHQDIAFLAKELGRDAETIMRVVISARLEAAFKVDAPAFYAFLRQHIPAALPSPLLDASQNFTLIGPLIHRIGSLIFALSGDTQKKTLTAAVALDQIGTQFTKRIPNWVSQLQALRPADLLQQPYLVGNTTLGELLDVAALPAPKQQAFAHALATSTQSMRNFWRTLGDGKHGFTAAEASAIERTLSVGAFVKNFVPLIQVLVQRFTAGTYTTLPDLARLSLDDWVQLVNQTGAPPGIDAAGPISPAQVFAAVIFTRVTRAYPTAALSGRILAGTFVPPPQQRQLVQFFQNNPALELIKDNLPAYLTAQGDKAFAGISAQDRPAVIANLRGFQRVLRVAPHVDVAENLLSLGFKSATQIATLGQQQFFVKSTAAGLTKPEANQVYRAAAQRYAQLVALYLRFNTDAVGTLPQSLEQLSDLTGLAQQAIKRDQSLATLFGSQDYCATDDCTSILSAAAYLCDLLLWLRNHEQNNQQNAHTILDVLDSRRPDIRHLVLNCPNTDTELPYIDLVNELLADKVSPPIDALSTSFTQNALIDGTPYYYIVTAVNAKGESAASTQVSATPVAATAVPAAPAGVAAVPGDKWATISWNAVAGATAYNLYWSTTPGVTTANGTKVADVASPYVQTGLTNGTTHCYIVTAVNAKGESAPSAEASALAAVATAVPAAPTGVAAVAGDGQVTLTWNPVANAASYNVYWATTSGVTTSTGTKIPSASPLVQTSLADGTTCYYIVTAVNGVGESAPSAQVSAMPAEPAAVPAAPAGVAAVAGDGEVTLSWNPVAGATSYNIYWATVPGVTTTTGTEITGSRNPRWKQTAANRTAEELGAAPEYFNQGAFVALFGASYPFALPYSAGLDGLRTYLQQWKLPLWQLRQALLPLAGGTIAQRTAVAAERFGLPPHGQDLIAIANLASPAVVWNTANPGPDLAPVDVFLEAASITYEQLLELLQVQWVQNGVGVAIQGINDLCMTSAESLAPAPLDVGFLDRAHRFLRLWNSAGYKMWELDLLLQSAAVANGTLDASGLSALLAFRQLQDATGLAVDRQLAFYQDIDTATHRNPNGTTTIALYAQIFLNPTVTAVAPDADLDVLPAGGSIVDPNLSHHQPALQAALGVSAGDVTTLFGLTDNQLTLKNLSLIYRVGALAAVSKLAVSDLTAMAQLLNPGATGATALAPLFASPAATLAFLSQAKAMQPSGLGMDALIYLLTPPIATTLSAPLAAVASTLAVASDAGFPSPNFHISIGSEILQVTAVSGAGNTKWNVARGQQGTTATAAAAGATVGLTDGWATTTQMTQADIAATLAAIQQAIQSLPTTLASGITAAQTTLTVASNGQFPPPNFYVSIGSEILLVTAVGGANNTTWAVARGQSGTVPAAAASGATVMPVSANTTLAAPLTAVATTLTVTSDAGFPQPPLYVSVASEILQVTAVGGAGNTTWTVVRGQQNTAAAAAAAGATVSPTGANLNGSIIATVAFNAHSASNSALANDVVAVMLNTLQVPGTSQTLLAVLADPVFTSSTNAISPANFPAQFLAIRIFDKAGIMVRGVRLVASDLRWLLTQASVYGGLDFTQLPVTPAQSALNLQLVLTTLLLVKMTRLWDAAPPQASTQTLYDVIGGVSSGALGSEGATQTALATIAGWPLTDIAAFAQALGFAFPASYMQPAAYDALRALEAMAVSAGANGTQMIAWGATPTDEPTAEGIAAGALGVLKAQQPSNDAWLALAPGIMNPIRERRAAALRAYLIGQKGSSGKPVYGDADGLFDYFLIDTQMSSCQVTSRVVQAYITVQTFVERCLLGLEAPEVVIDPDDTTWKEWEWRSRYRLWEANREVLQYPENWLIESLRSNRTEIYRKLEQEVRQGQSTMDYLETVVLNYIDRLDGLAHLLVTGTCEDATNGDIYVVARTLADPPVFYYRSYANGAWSGWVQILLDVKAHQAVPAMYRGRLCLFWPVVKVSNEPRQNTGVAQQSSSQTNQEVAKYVSISLNFSIFRNGAWAPAQATKGELFDVPILASSRVSHAKSVEALYTLKVQMAPSQNGSSYAPSLYLDVFRLGDYPYGDLLQALIYYIDYAEAMGSTDSNGNPAPDYAGAASNLSAYLAELDKAVEDGAKQGAVHLGRAVFDGRFSDLELNDSTNVLVTVSNVTGETVLPPLFGGPGLLGHAQAVYGPDARPLLPLDAPDPDLVSDSGLIPEAGALATGPADPTQGSAQTFQLDFTSVGALEQNPGALLNAAPVPVRVVGPVTDLAFDPTSYFFFQDNRRCYWAEPQKFYWTGSAWSPVVPSDPASTPYEVRYWFHLYYHPFTRLFWNQLAGGGFDLLYDPNLQQNPDQIDPSGADVFGFNSGYQPTWRVKWDHDDVTGADRQFLDFSRSASFSVYNWELFYHIPIYIAQLLSQNQQFENARSWFHYVFNPTRQGTDPAPQRFWIPKPLHNLTSTQILGQQINVLLQAVNQGDPAALQQVAEWQADPYDPFLLADLRLGVPYMKYTVMSYLDNLIAWADNLFSIQSREALSEATLLYVTAAEILGPTPAAVTPPQHADESFDQLEPALDAFANALVEIENVIGGAGGGTGGGDSAGGIPLAQTFYFKIPPNKRLLGYWSTVAGRLNKMRHCQTISGAPLQLALFDAPIDPGLLIAARAAGIDLSSVLSNIFIPLPNYRFTALYPVALDFVNAVRAYGSSLQAALEKSDAGALALLQQTTQQQLLIDGNQILQWQIDQASDNINALQQSLALAQQKNTFNTTQPYMNTGETIADSLSAIKLGVEAGTAIADAIAGIASGFPDFLAGVEGFGGSPSAILKEGSSNAAKAASFGALAIKDAAAAMDDGIKLATTHGSYDRRQDNWTEAAAEAQIQIQQAQAQIDGATLALQIAQQNQTLHQGQIDNLQKQIDFLNTKFSNDSLYDWMAGSLAATYFQSYQLAYQMCKAVERCYQFELGLQSASFIQFGYWDSLYKGLLAGETLNHDLRRMQSSYFQENSRRYEISRFVPLSKLNPNPLTQLLATGACDFKLPESLFDNDYPGHYNRRVTRVSVSVVYPNPGKFDNIKATLTLVANQVRISTDTTAGYCENPVGSDPRFVYNYAAVPQKIALGNAQDDPGLFVTAITNNLSDPRYLPFENAGVASHWHLDMPQASNEINLVGVQDVVLHLYYTALDGGATFQGAVQPCP